MEIDLYEFEFLSSTQIWAKKHLQRFHRSRLSVVFAKTQTQGYGRSGHSWESPSGNLYLSLVFFTPPLPFLHRTTQWASLIVCEWLRAQSIEAIIKWPNDLLVKGKKTTRVLDKKCSSFERDFLSDLKIFPKPIAMCPTGEEKFLKAGRKDPRMSPFLIQNSRKIGGLLTELKTSDEAVIVGLGINVNACPPQATSMKEEIGKPFDDLTPLLHTLTTSFSSSLPLFLSAGFSPFQLQFDNRLLHKKGDTLRFTEGRKKVEGIFLGLDPSGALLIEQKGGAIFRSFNGNVE